MAFNLNKNDEASSERDLSKKMKFDLSKTDSSTTINEDKPGKSKIWPFALMGLLLLGGGAWYFLSKSDTTNLASDASIPPVQILDTVSTPEVSQVGLDSMATIESLATEVSDSTLSIDSTTKGSTNAANNTSPNIDVANLNNKVIASFDKSSVSFSNVDKYLVSNLIAFLETNPNASITVDGFTSSEGDLTINQELSQSRADTFKQYLISKGVSADRIVTNGKGVNNPIALNDTEEGRQKNRRVEISIQ
jgi:outer membrane protein OmpA-like peptidoglycan-associated protein